MSVTTVIFLLLFITGVILTLRNPYWGIALYIFEWHNHPPYMWWGESLPDLRWTLLVSIITLVSMFINFGKLRQLRNANYNLIWWLIAFTVWMYFISAFFAVNPAESFKKSEDMLKLTVQIFLMMFLVRSIEQHKIVIWTMILCVANFGRVAWQRGSNRYLGVIAPSATEENAVSAHVASLMSFFGLYFLVGKRWEKIVTMLSVPFLLNLIILANSRASFLALLVIGLLAFIWIKGRLRWAVLGAMVVGAFLILYLSNEQFWERQSTITSYEQESSARSREYLWAGAINMWMDYPIGIGGEGFEELVFDYVPELVPEMREKGARTVHSTFFVLLVSWGPVGVILFFGFTLHTLLILFKVRRRAYLTPNYRFYIDAMAIQMGIFALLAAGITHDRLYAEVYYWFGAFAVVLQNLQTNQILEDNEKDQDNKETILSNS